MKTKLNKFQIGIGLVGIGFISSLIGIEYIIHGVIQNDRALLESIVLNSAGKTDSIMK